MAIVSWADFVGMGRAQRSPINAGRCGDRVSLRSTHPTTEYDFAILAARCARGLPETSRPLCQRAQGRPGARCTRGPACDLRKQKCTRAYRVSGNTPAFPAQWLYGLLRALPGERLLLPPSLHEKLSPVLSRTLSASTAASGPHDFAVRFRRVRLARLCVHRISPHVRDDRERPSSAVRRAELCR